MKKPSIQRRVELRKLYTETCLKFGAEISEVEEAVLHKETDDMLRKMKQVDRVFFVGLSCADAEAAGLGKSSPTIELPPSNYK